MSLKILITALELDSYSGVPLYTRDVALELKRRGHVPEIYTLKMGAVAEELLRANILVTDNPSRISNAPDIIHGQHRVSTMIAIKQCRRAPAVFICHNHIFWGDAAPFHPRILQYFGMSLVCMQRLKTEGVPEHKVHFLENFVNTDRFLPRDTLPEFPQRALVFSNFANEHTHLPAVREACRLAGLTLKVIGKQADHSLTPETELGKYDIVFAKAKAAIEAMAVGSAVILCDFSGVGPMVTVQEFDRLRLMNFGFQALTDPLHPENVLAKIKEYNPREAALVRDLIRSTSSLEVSVTHLLSMYHTVIEESRHKGFNGVKHGKRAAFNEMLYWERARFWASLTPAQDRLLKPFSRSDPAAWGKKRILINTEAIYLAGPTLLERFLRAWTGEMHELKPRMVVMVEKILAKIWMCFPESLRMRIKNMPVVEVVLKKIKRILNMV
jgi:hypothetical protein